MAGPCSLCTVSSSPSSSLEEMNNTVPIAEGEEETELGRRRALPRATWLRGRAGQLPELAPRGAGEGRAAQSGRANPGGVLAGRSPAPQLSEELLLREGTFQAEPRGTGEALGQQAE